jgi:uncharacterized protein YjbJ (UPF0337 family)
VSKKEKNKSVMIEDEERFDEVDENRDPISGETGAHPVGVAAGGTSGAAAGSAIGTAVGGPLGGIIGAAAGAIAGGLAGKGVAETVNPTEEEKYWREAYQTRPYYRIGRPYEQYEPGYRYGWESASRPEYQGRSFEEVESQLAGEWPSYYSAADFSEYRDAARDAYERIFEGSMGDRKFNFDENQFFDRVRANWLHFKKAVLKRWNLLSDEDVDRTTGRREQLINKIQEKYPEEIIDREQLREELTQLSRNC